MRASASLPCVMQIRALTKLFIAKARSRALRSYTTMHSICRSAILKVLTLQSIKIVAIYFEPRFCLLLLVTVLNQNHCHTFRQQSDTNH